MLLLYSRSIFISIHALREERDKAYLFTLGVDAGFQSTRSARSATAKKHKTEEYFFVINIKYYESFR